jgi:tripartite-type tricarboxylate transporter receptor subunit TctC
MKLPHRRQFLHLAAGATALPDFARTQVRIANAIWLATGVLALSTPVSLAQEAFPSRLVKIVVPAAAGSTTDALARIVADRLARTWGNSVIVENIAGGATNIGAAAVSRAAPDGHTLMVAPPAPLSYNDLLYKELGYSPTGFTPITLLATIPNILIVRKGLPISSLSDLIGYGKGNPGKLSYASQGVGSTAHLSASQLEVSAGIKMVHVPYRGSAPALNDIIAGHIDMFFDTLATSVPLYRDGKLKILGVADVRRARAVPEIPTFSEAGLPGFHSITWFGLVAPPRTPEALAERINRDVVAILKTGEVGAKLRELSLDTGATTRADAAKFFAEETALWGHVIKESGITLQ